DYQTKYEGYDPNSVESFIIFSLMQNTYLKQSTEFASMIQDQFRDRVGRKDRGVKQGNLLVLWKSTMPSVLVELGFISNPEEERYLISEAGQDYLASAIFRAFRDYKNSIDNRSGIKPLIGEKQDKVEENPVQAIAERNDTPSVPVAGNPTAVPAPGKTSPAASAGNGIVFMVQIAAVPKNKTSEEVSFKGIDTVTRIESGERYKYAAGRFSLFEEAVEYRRVITKDYPDAYVIAVRNGKVIPLKDAVDEINSNNKK
ncbi:MAG: N-acetylmuramoyl-L-alanine amidase, partial [Bacteroidales bacterium]|nr:N-acetylmuramoyl-L-alanine amidase [Bacteroidales bacterium]